MRKPLVVIGAAAAAVLIGGAVLATTAGAETAPAERPAEAPTAAVALPAVPDVPQVPGTDLADLLDQVQDQAAGQAQGDPAPQQPADEPAQEPVADTPQRPGGQDPAPQQPAAQQQPAQQRPAQQRPAQQDAPEQPVRQKPAFSAQQDVSPANVSGAADAPVQRRALELVNEQRRRGGCDDLTTDRRLIVAANRHAADMARRGYFDHYSPGGDGAGDRVEDAGYRWKRYGENIARGQESVAEVVDGWMNSRPHRENIMDCDLEQMGIGLAFDGDEAIWVQDFATPKR